MSNFNSTTVLEREATTQADAQSSTSTTVRTDERPITPQPTHGICGHIAKSDTHTCGNFYCIRNYGYGW